MKYFVKCIGIIPLIISAISLSACLSFNSTKVTSDSGADMQSARQDAYNGPKARIAIIDFEDKTRNNRYWKNSFGSGMREMMVTALFNTNRYIVLERTKIAAIEAERQRYGRKAKKLEDADIMVTAAVTEWEPGAAGASGKTGTGRLLDWTSVTGAFNQSHVAIDLRVIDVDSGRIISANSVEGKSNSFSAGAHSWMGGISNSLGGYAKSPMESAIREVINKSVEAVVAKTPKTYYRYK